MAVHRAQVAQAGWERDGKRSRSTAGSYFVQAVDSSRNLSGYFVSGSSTTPNLHATGLASTFSPSLPFSPEFHHSNSSAQSQSTYADQPAQPLYNHGPMVSVALSILLPHHSSAAQAPPPHQYASYSTPLVAGNQQSAYGSYSATPPYHPYSAPAGSSSFSVLPEQGGAPLNQYGQPMYPAQQYTEDLRASQQSQQRAPSYEHDSIGRHNRTSEYCQQLESLRQSGVGQ